VDHNAFRDGYVAGWRSVEGDAENPTVPASPESVGDAMYLIGFHAASAMQGVQRLLTSDRLPPGLGDFHPNNRLLSTIEGYARHATAGISVDHQPG
jgi:hypothetical protein